MKYFCYRHIRLDMNKVFYVGRGTVKKNCVSYETIYCRAFEIKCRSYHWKNITNQTKINIEVFYESDSFEEIKLKEIEFIKLYGRKDLGKGELVNFTDGGDGGTGSVYTEERRNKVSEANKRRIHKPFTDAHKAKISLAGKGKKPWNKGKKNYFPEETINKFKEQRKGERNGMYGKVGYWKEKKQHVNTQNAIKEAIQRKITQFTLNYEFVKDWNSIIEAKKSIGVGCIRSCLANKTKTAGGFIWKYKN